VLNINIFSSFSMTISRQSRGLFWIRSHLKTTATLQSWSRDAFGDIAQFSCNVTLWHQLLLTLSTVHGHWFSFLLECRRMLNSCTWLLSFYKHKQVNMCTCIFKIRWRKVMYIKTDIREIFCRLFYQKIIPMKWHLSKLLLWVCLGLTFIDLVCNTFTSDANHTLNL